jgi:Protein of unknown function (DUF3054)
MALRKSHMTWLVAGDLLSLAAVTLFGFAFHETLDFSRLYRVLATFLPLTLGWFLIGYHVGVFDLDKAGAARQLWRPVWTMVLAGPFAALLRALMLGADAIVPIFVIVLLSVGALGMFLWRAVFSYWLSRRSMSIEVS